MNEQEVLKILAEVSAIIRGHFVLASDRHAEVYVNKDAVYPHIEIISRLCRAIAERFAADGVEVVIGPAIGGVILSQRVAEHLSRLTDREVLSIYAEKKDGAFVIKRGYDRLVAGRRVLVVEDVLTTGGSAKKVVEAVRALGGEVVGLGVLCNRGSITPADVGDVPKLFALANISLEDWDEKDCPLCAQKVLINVEVGRGREFLARQQSL